MERMNNTIKKNEKWAYFILASRLLLAWVFIGYGYGKLSGGQFGLSSEEMAMPVGELSLFKLSWYIFDHQPFKAFIGISQIVCGCLLIVNRTALLGALMLVPIIVNILIIDLTIMSEGMAYAFTWRLGWYLILDFLIIWYHKIQIKVIWERLWEKKPFSKFPIWRYLLLPLVVLVIQLIGWIPRILIAFIQDPSNTIVQLGELVDLLIENFHKLM